MENIIFCGWFAKSNFNLSIALLIELKKYYNVHYFGDEMFCQRIKDLDIEFYSYIGIDEIKEDYSKIKYFYPDENDISNELVINIEAQHNESALRYYSQLTSNMMETTKRINPKFIVRDNSAIIGKFLSKELKIKCIAFNSMLNILDEDMEKNPEILYPLYKKNYIGRFKLVEKDFYKKIKMRCRENSKNLNLPYVSPICTVDSEDDINISFGGSPFQTRKIYSDKEYLIFKSPLRQMEGYEEDDEELDTFINSERDLLYVGSGSFLTQENQYYNNIINACANKDINVLISIPNLQNYNANLPKNILIRKFVPQKKILKKAKLFLTSGGYNSFSEAINYGVPLVITPIDFDQEYNAYLTDKYRIGKKIYINDINEFTLKDVLDISSEYALNMKNIKETFFDGLEISEGIKYIISKVG